MIKKKYRLKGHESFMVRAGWIEKGLAVVAKDPAVFLKNYGADALGVGSNMAKSIRFWLTCGNLVEDKGKQGVILSPIGRVIFDNDPCLEDLFTVYFIHYLLVSNHDKLTTFYMFFNHVDMDEFQREDIFSIIYKKICEELELDEISSRSLTDDIQCLFQMYAKTAAGVYDPEEKKISPFSELGLLKKDGIKYRKNQPQEENIDGMLILYVINELLLKMDKNSISIDELMTCENGPARIFNLKRYLLNLYLDELVKEGYLNVNRTAGLDMVYLEKPLKSIDIILDYYSKHENKKK